MTILFQNSLNNLIANQGVIAGVMGGDPVIGTTTPSTATVAVTIFSGVQPSAATITSGWTSYNTTFLAHWTGVGYQYIGSNIPGVGLISQSNTPTAVLAANSGTASWGIIWGSNVAAGSSSGQIGGSTLPNTRFIVGPVSLAGGNGMISLSTLTIVSGVSQSLTNSSINIS
jgi:hypothetical protein